MFGSEALIIKAVLKRFVSSVSSFVALCVLTVEMESPSPAAAGSAISRPTRAEDF